MADQAPSVTHTLPEADVVRGVTSLDDELYVARASKEKGVVEVYSTATYGLLRELSAPGLEGSLDMASCKHFRCLYISDCLMRGVCKLALNGDVINSWPIDDEPSGLSVTPQFTVVVTCYETKRLLEFSTDGNLLREIKLQSDIVHPQQAIQLSNGQFVICHGWPGDSAQRVCIVDVNGQITQSYGGPEGSATVGQLKGPWRLAVGKDESIYVADYGNKRVLLLSPTLNYVSEIVSRDQFKYGPERLFLDVDSRRLYVADSSWRESAGRVLAIKL